MATNTNVIQDALGLLGVTDDFTMTAEYGALGLRVMNDLLLQWGANEVDVGYAEQDTLTDTSPILPEHMLAVKYNLAVALSPYFGKEPSGALVALAVDSFKKLQRAEQVSRLAPVSMSHTHLGEIWGAHGGRYNIETDS